MAHHSFSVRLRAYARNHYIGIRKSALPILTISTDAEKIGAIHNKIKCGCVITDYFRDINAKAGFTKSENSGIIAFLLAGVLKSTRLEVRH